MLQKARLLLVGCGSMGGALLKGWLSSLTFPIEFDVVSPGKSSVDPFLSDSRVHYFSDAESFFKEREKQPVDILVYAAKPHMTESILPEYKSLFPGKTIFMSVAAGKNFSHYKAFFPGDTSFVRVMPNTPSAVGKGVSLLTGENLSESYKSFISRLMEAVGKAFWVESEDALDRATLISGCGPAYLFAFIEALQDAGIEIGLSSGQSKELTLEVLSGALHYYQSMDLEADALRKEVTSPGGVTEAVLDILTHKDRGFKTLFKEAFKNGYDRTCQIQKR